MSRIVKFGTVLPKSDAERAFDRWWDSVARYQLPDWTGAIDTLKELSWKAWQEAWYQAS